MDNIFTYFSMANKDVITKLSQVKLYINIQIWGQKGDLSHNTLLNYGTPLILFKFGMQIGYKEYHPKMQNKSNVTMQVTTVI